MRDTKSGPPFWEVLKAATIISISSLYSHLITEVTIFLPNNLNHSLLFSNRYLVRDLDRMLDWFTNSIGSLPLTFPTPIPIPQDSTEREKVVVGV